MELLHWIDEDNLCIDLLNRNENAIDYLNRHPDKIRLKHLFRNKKFNILPFIFEQFDHIDDESIMSICTNIQSDIESIIRQINYKQQHWTYICSNPSCIELIEENPKQFIHNWSAISMNKNAYSLIIHNFQYIDWNFVCLNQSMNVLHFIIQYPEKLNWNLLSMNPAAISILKLYPSRIVYWALSCNYNAIDLIEQNLDKISWSGLSKNKNAIHLLEKHKNFIDWKLFSMNPSIFYNYQQESMERMDILREDLVKKSLHPSRIQYWLENGLSIDDL
jgi:hypothetical protein